MAIEWEATGPNGGHRALPELQDPLAPSPVSLHLADKNPFRQSPTRGKSRQAQHRTRNIIRNPIADIIREIQSTQTHRI
eukprot:712277-Lingulodinium_polyedra.AAC.1